MIHDLQLSLRLLAKNAGATVLSIVSIALGIGLTTGVFSIGDAMLLRPLPIERPGEVLTVSSRADTGSGLAYGWADYLDMAEAGRDMVTLAAYDRMGSMLDAGEENEMVITHAVTPNYFTLLGVKAAAGRASVGVAEGRLEVVLGHRLWLRRFGGDPTVVGRTILLNRKLFLVAGVMPASFVGTVRMVPTDVWVGMDGWFSAMGRRGVQQERDGQVEMMVRLKPGVKKAEAEARLDAAIRGEGKHKPAPAGGPGTYLEAKFAPGWARTAVFGGGLSLALGLILIAACANVAQLRMAQAEARRKDLGVRMALGAGGWRLMRQLLVETGLVCLAGAGLGVLLAQVLMAKVSQFVSNAVPYFDMGLGLDYRVLTFALAAVLLCLVVAGLAPARQAVSLDVWDTLKTDQGVAGGRSSWRKKALIAGQVAVSVACVGMAVLFAASLWNAMAIRPGMDPDKKLFAAMVAPGARGSRVAWCEELCNRLAGLPGVRGATFARRLPLASSGGGLTARVEVPGQAPRDVMLNHVGGNYFAVMGTRVLAGRGIDTNDRKGSPLAAVVSVTFARQVFGVKNPVGEWISVDGKMRQVVGVAEDGPSYSFHEATAPYLFLPFAQAPSGELTVMVETAGEPEALARAIRAEMKRYDPGVTVFTTTTLRRQMDQALAMDRMMATIVSGLGLFAVLLTAAGLFGLMQYTVNRRTRELGLRMALGARPERIQRMVLGESLRMAAWGIPIGLAMMGAAAWSVRSMVIGIGPLDGWVYGVAAAAVLAVSVAAGWIPARRATRVDPMAALRSE